MEAGGMMVSISGAELSEEDQQNMRRMEEKIAACMKQRGFEYVPNPPTDDGPSEFDEAYALDPVDFAEQYGYGVSTMGFEEPGDDEASDPNQKIRESLSAAAAEEYDKALWGNELAAPGEDGFTAAKPLQPDGETDPDQIGCQQRAAEEVLGSPEDVTATDMDQFRSLFDDISTLQERIDNDPRVSEAEQAWVQCMADAGYGDFDALADAQLSVHERMQQLTGGPQDADGPSLSDGADNEVDIDEAALEELQAYEIDVATADYDCRQDGYQDVYDEVSHELQEEFIRQHRDELERYRESMARDGATETDT